jgi:hypothetical protein
MVAAGMAANASAAVLSETDVPDGAFGPSWNKVTEVGAGITGVTGTGSQNVFDNFHFTALPVGAQKIDLRFWAPDGIGNSYSAGGKVLFSRTPFLWGWDGKELGGFQLDLKGVTSAPLTLLLGDEFKGGLYLALNFTHGKAISYSIDLGTTVVAPVPLPAGVLLVGTALGGLGLLRARSRRQPA